MNICFIGNYTGGGTESATYLVANGLCGIHDIFILNTSSRSSSFYLKPNIHFDYLEPASVSKRIMLLAKYIKNNKIDVLISVEAMTGIFSIAAAAITRCRHIVWEHANYYQNQGSRWIRIIRQIELLSADAYVVLTERDKKNFSTHFKIKTRLEQIYNIAEQQKACNYNQSSRVIISAGHIRKIKNFAVIPEIAKTVFQKHPDWCWKIYGDTTGDEYERIKSKIEELGIQEKLIFAGRSDRMEKIYQSAAMYVMTSLQEGLPMVLLEAKSNKLPLISFNIETGPDEIIRDGVNGYLVDAYDTDIMAERICELIEDEPKRKQFSEASAIDLERFGEKEILEKWMVLVDEL